MSEGEPAVSPEEPWGDGFEADCEADDAGGAVVDVVEAVELSEEDDEPPWLDEVGAFEPVDVVDDVDVEEPPDDVDDPLWPDDEVPVEPDDGFEDVEPVVSPPDDDVPVEPVDVDGGGEEGVTTWVTAARIWETLWLGLASTSEGE